MGICADEGSTPSEFRARTHSRLIQALKGTLGAGGPPPYLFSRYMPFYGVGFLMDHAYPMHIGVDVDTWKISYGILDANGDFVNADWIVLPRDDEFSNAWYAFDSMRWLFTNSPFGTATIEMIPMTFSGSGNVATADKINRVAMGVSLGLIASNAVLRSQVRSVAPRTWMSKTCGLENGRNASKERIREWARMIWPDIPDLTDHHIKTRGVNKGTGDPNDCYDGICVAAWGRMKYLGDI